MTAARTWFPYALFAVVAGTVVCIGGYPPSGLLVVELGAAGLGVALAFDSFIGGSVPSQLKHGPGVFLFAYAAFQACRVLWGHTEQWYLSFTSLLLLCACFILLLISSEVGTVERSSRAFSRCLAIFGPTLAVYSLVQLALGNGDIYWFYRPPQSPELSFGPFLNRNHYAAAMELLLPFCAFGATRAKTPRSRSLAVVGSLLIVASVIASRSRAGILIMTAEIAALVALSELPRRSRALLSLAVIALLAALIGIDSLNARGSTLARFTDLQNQEDSGYSRITIAQDTIAMIRSRPLLGFGLGTFRRVYPEFQSFPGTLAVTHAHNDYLESIAESGLLGALPWFLFICAVLHRSLRSRVRSIPQMACMVALPAFLLHSLVDFNLYVPANAALFYSICGLAVARADSPARVTQLLRVHRFEGADRHRWREGLSKPR